MIDGRHEELDFEFMVDGELFDKLIYLVDGIYPPLTRFLSSESDPHRPFTSDQANVPCTNFLLAQISFKKMF